MDTMLSFSLVRGEKPPNAGQWVTTSNAKLMLCSVNRFGTALRWDLDDSKKVSPRTPGAFPFGRISTLDVLTDVGEIIPGRCPEE